MAPTPKIAIIGAGPAGLTLARLLHVSEVKVDVTLYEIDASRTSRPAQGGTLDLHATTGLAAVRKCGLWNSFINYARYEGSELIIVDKNKTELLHLRGGKKEGQFARPEIDRVDLREILLESVPDELVRWGWHLREVKEDGMLRFDGKKEMEGPFDLIVGADGAWSKIRARLNGLQPTYSGVSGYEMEIAEPARTCPQVNKMAGKGGFFGTSDRKCLNCQRMGNGSLKVRSWYICAEGETQETVENFGKQKTVEKALEKYSSWAPEITELLRQAELDSLKHWTIYELPVGSKWEHKPGFTLMGDAQSLSAPFSSEGVNKAMTDALELAELIEKSQNATESLTLDQAVLHYEQQLFPRAEKVQTLAAKNKEMLFGGSAPIGLFTALLDTLSIDNPSILVKILGTAPVRAVVYTYFWILVQIGWAVRTFWRRT